jgi:excisionase family DNA binding protein
MDERYYTIDQVAERFGVTRAGVYKWMKSGQLRYVVVGAHRRITESAIREFVKDGRPEDVDAQEHEPAPKTPGLPVMAIGRSNHEDDLRHLVDLNGLVEFIEHPTPLLKHRDQPAAHHDTPIDLHLFNHYPRDLR